MHDKDETQIFCFKYVTKIKLMSVICKLFNKKLI